MSLETLLPRLRKYPGMYAPGPTFLSVCGFVAGYRWGADDETLNGFHEWLTNRIAVRPELGWPWLVLCEIYPPDQLPDPRRFSEEEDALAISVLFDLLETFYSSARAS